MVTAGAWQGGAVILRRIGAAVVRQFSANGYGFLDLLAGEYELAIIGASGVYATINRVGDRP